jgi:hypothetical protein
VGKFYFPKGNIKVLIQLTKWSGFIQDITKCPLDFL